MALKNPGCRPPVVSVPPILAGMFLSVLVLVLTSACENGAGEGHPDGAVGDGAALDARVADDASSPAPDGGTGDPICGQIDVSLVELDDGHAYRLGRNFGFRGDSAAEPTRSPLQLLEDGVLLGPSHAEVTDIRSSGAGAYRHWGNGLVFSSSDNTDPRTNGRTYEFAGPCWQPATIDLIEVSPSTTHYATFQSHNQRIVDSHGSIFISYLSAMSGEYATWHVVRSTDQGQTFSPVLGWGNTSKAPALERDDQGNVYAVLAQDHSSSMSPALFYRLNVADDFAPTNPININDGAAGKFTLYFDSVRQQLYYFTFWDAPIHNFFAVNLNGSVAYSMALTQPGSHSRIQYPFLSMVGADLFAGWTTSPTGTSNTNYWDIHWMMSSDGGNSWKQSINGQSLALPVVADDTGPTNRITLDDEFGPDTWLAAMHARGSSLHLMYNVYQMQRQHYVRVNTFSGTVERNIYPIWRGSESQMRAFDGFFVSQQDGWLFAVGNGGFDAEQRILVLASDDNGETWLDYARSEPISDDYYIYSVSGSRRLSEDGHILGAFTRQQRNGTDHLVMFFRVDATRTLP